MRPGRKQRAFSGVTAKSRQQQVNRITLVQHGIFLFLLIAVGVELGSAESSDYVRWGAILWALVMAATLATQNSMVSLSWDMAQSARIALTAPVVVGVLLVLMAIWSPFPGAPPPLSVASSDGTAQVINGSRKPAVEPRRELVPPRRGLYLGLYEPDLAYGNTNQLKLRLASYEPAKVRLVHRFQHWWGRDRFFQPDWANKVAAAGAVPMITWESWARPVYDEPDIDYEPGQLGHIAHGKYDTFLRKWAKDVADYRKPVVIRLWHEMNGSWYPWRVDNPQYNSNGNTAAEFKAAWRHVVDVFNDNGARNVSWVWSIDTMAGGTQTSYDTLKTYYPGDKYVDWTGLSGFNWAQESVDPGERSFLGTFEPAYSILDEFDKPVMLSEIGVSDTSVDAAAWLTSAFKDAREMPDVKAIVWYSQDTDQAHFGLRPTALDALRTDGGETRMTPRLRTTLAP
jgi:cytochrome c oxidase subunit IV